MIATHYCRRDASQLARKPLSAVPNADGGSEGRRMALGWMPAFSIRPTTYALSCARSASVSQNGSGSSASTQNSSTHASACSQRFGHVIVVRLLPTPSLSRSLAYWSRTAWSTGLRALRKRRTRSASRLSSSMVIGELPQVRCGTNGAFAVAFHLHAPNGPKEATT